MNLSFVVLWDFANLPEPALAYLWKRGETMILVSLAVLEGKGEALSTCPVVGAEVLLYIFQGRGIKGT